MSTLLIADHVEERRTRMRALIRREGHRTLLASDGPSALDKALRSAPAMVLADAALPGLDGYGLALNIREELDPDTVRVLILKDDVTPDDRTTAAAVGADELLPRQIGDEHLLDAVRSFLANRQPQGAGLAGQIDDESLFAILQFLHQRRETGTLSLAGPGLTGTIVYTGGEIIAARTRAAESIAAFQELLRLREGRYCFDGGLVDPIARNIERSFDPLMMDAFVAMG